MQLVKLITHKIIKALGEFFHQVNTQNKIHRTLFSTRYISIFFVACLQLMASEILNAQDNSPYSRFGIGDLHPSTSILNRGMGGISAAYADQFSVNFSNPASYSRFFSLLEGKSKKSSYGRILLDVGLNFDNRTLRETNNPKKYTVGNAYFSYLQLGIPIKKDLGIVFGLRPISRINYKVGRNERLFDPVTGLPIDSAITEFSGNGGTFLFNTGIGYAIKNFSVGINAGYLFGRKDYSTQRTFINDSVAYAASNHQTKTALGDLFFNAGMQYRVDLNKGKTKYLQFGVFGNTKQNINSTSDIIRETFSRGADGADFRIDSVSENLNIKGKIIFPATFGGGFLIEKLQDIKSGGWLFGIDYTQSSWNDYRYNGQIDSVRNNWKLKIGGQIKPSLKESKYKNYMAYRAGLFLGNDYVFLNKKLPEIGVTAGITLPIANLKDAQRRFRTQYSLVNISAEYIKRGKKDNLLRENLFRVSVGFSLSDLWFTKRKYE